MPTAYGVAMRGAPEQAANQSKGRVERHRSRNGAMRRRPPPRSNPRPIAEETEVPRLGRDRDEAVEQLQPPQTFSKSSLPRRET